MAESAGWARILHLPLLQRPLSRAALGACIAILVLPVLGGGLQSAQAQEVTIDRWHSISEACPGGGTVQIRPVAVIGEKEEVKAWRVELRVPDSSACSLPQPGRLRLMVDGVPAPGTFAPADGAVEAQLTVRDTTVRKIAQADEVRVVENAIEGRAPSVFLADVRRLLKKAPAAAQQADGTNARDTSGSSSGNASEDGGAEKSSRQESEEVYTVVDENPSVVGGMGQIQEVLQYPEAAKQKGLEGRVLVRVVVTEDGKAQDPQVIRGVHELLNKEALRAVRQLTFEPGKLRGEAVKTRMILPVTFRLPEEEK